MSRTLVIFHSRTGTARKVALGLANQHDWPIGEIQPRRRGASFPGCIAQALLRLRPAIDYRGPDPAAFDLVVLVSPVWCGTLSGPMRSFLARYGAVIRSHAVCMVMGGRGGAAAARDIDRLLGRPARAVGELLEASVRNDQYRPEMDAFARRLEGAAETDARGQIRRAA